jgi:hypothetical protein
VSTAVTLTIRALFCPNETTETNNSIINSIFNNAFGQGCCAEIQ